MRKEVGKMDPAEEVGRVLAEEPKVKIRIPLNPLNEDDRVVPVCINGYNYFLNRGESVEVPAPVAELLEMAAYI